MFVTLRRLMRHHLQAAGKSFMTLCQQPFASAMTVLVIAITLTLPALLWVFTDNMSILTNSWKRGGHVSLYLEMDASPSEYHLLLARVRKIHGVGEAVLKTPEEGILELQHQEGMQDLLSNLPDNPLPAVIDIVPASYITTPAQLETLYTQLKKIAGVDDARMDMQWMSRLYALLDVMGRLTHVLMLLLAIAVVFIICNTLRLVIQRYHEEIQVLKLIGATDAFIVRPFLYSGVWYGLFSALLAILFVALFMLSLRVVMHQMIDAFQMHVVWFGLSFLHSLLLMLVASFLGLLGASISVRYQLSTFSV